MSRLDGEQAMLDAARLRPRALTAEQLARREEVARRTAIISAGVKPPASGIFGKPKGTKA